MAATTELSVEKALEKPCGSRSTAAPNGRVTNVLYQQPFSRTARVLGTWWIEWVHPDDREGVLKSWRDAVSPGEEFETEVRVRFPDGTLS